MLYPGTEPSLAVWLPDGETEGWLVEMKRGLEAVSGQTVIVDVRLYSDDTA